MKKYNKPSIQVIKIGVEELLTVSGVRNYYSDEGQLSRRVRYNDEDQLSRRVRYNDEDWEEDYE